MFLKGKRFNTSGNQQEVSAEEREEKIGFNIFKFSNRKKENVEIFCCLSEFGCETIGVMYLLPKFKKENPDKYIIVVGWYGRDYLYRHLADEFWEIKEEHQWLRDTCQAFHHKSKNLFLLENNLTQFGNVHRSADMGMHAVCDFCNSCKHYWASDSLKTCTKCGGKNVTSSMFSDIEGWKKNVVKIPVPKVDVSKYVGDNCVGIFARNRSTYSRNLQLGFYENLIKSVRGMGYNVIWLGEAQSVWKCPVEDVIDFSRDPMSRNLDITLGIIAKLKFTIQFWTASTRLSSMVGTPYILFESPEQIYGRGQEGFRRKLCDFGSSKLVVAHYKDIYENNQKGLDLSKQAIEEVCLGNFDDIFASGTMLSQHMRQEFEKRVNK